MTRPPVVTVSFAVSRGVSAAVSLVLLAVGVLFLTAFWFGGLLDGWRIVLGLLPKRPVDELLLPVPLLVAGLLVVFPLYLFARMVIWGDDRRPRAFFFDNEARRFLVSEDSWTAENADRKNLSGYDYRDLVSFEITTYTTTTTREREGPDRTVVTVHYVVGFRKTDGEFWPLDEFLNESDARAFTAKLEAEVALKDETSAFAPKPPRLSPKIEELGGPDLTLAWRGRVAFGTAFWFLLGAAGLGWFALKLRDRGMAVEPVIILFVFTAVIGLLGVLLIFSSVRRALRKNALRLSNRSLEIGTLSKSGLFRARKSWPVTDVETVAAMFKLEMRRSKTKFLLVKARAHGDKNEKREQLDIAGLSLSEVIDLEHRLEQELNRRGAKTK